MFNYLLLITILITKAIADLTCQEYVPKNWTSSIAEAYVYPVGGTGTVCRTPPGTLKLELTRIEIR